MCDAAAQQQQQQSEKKHKRTGFYVSCAARRIEAGGSMGRAMWVMLDVTISQMRRGGHNNSINSSYVPISQVDERREAVSSQARCVTCSVQGAQHLSKG